MKYLLAAILLLAACSGDGNSAVVTFRGQSLEPGSYIVEWVVEGVEHRRTGLSLLDPCYVDARVGEKLPESCQ